MTACQQSTNALDIAAATSSWCSIDFCLHTRPILNPTLHSERKKDLVFLPKCVEIFSTFSHPPGFSIAWNQGIFSVKRLKKDSNILSDNWNVLGFRDFGLPKLVL